MKKNLLFVLLLGFLAFNTAWAQTRKVTGKVTSADDGQPLPGVSVQIQGTKQGVLTDGDGNFELRAATGQVLTFTYVGFIAQQATVPAGNFPPIRLKTNTRMLSDVVITDGYTVQAKKAYTGAAVSIGGEAVEDKPFSTPQQALQGELAGVGVTVNSGQPGAAVNVHIRGINSVSSTGAQNPLYVIDGMIVNSQQQARLATTQNPLAALNDDDIESVTVLKDAAATAIYGSRGGNGVIVITTKRGKAGKTQVRFDAETGISNNIPLPSAGKPLTGPQYASLFNTGLTNAGYSAAQLATLDNSYGINSGPGANWYDLVNRRGKQEQYNVSITGGTENTRVYSSLGYFRQDATTLASNFTRISGALNVDHNISKRISSTTNILASNINQNSPSNSGYFANPLLAAYFLRPFQNPYNPDGSINVTYNGANANEGFASIYNPLWTSSHDKKYDSATRIQTGETLRWNIWDELKFTSFASIDYNTIEEQEFLNPTLGDGRTYGGQGYAYYTRYFNWLVRNQLDYRYNVPSIENFYVDATVGYEAQQNQEYFINAYGVGYPATQPTLTALANAATPTTAADGTNQYNIDSFYARLSTNYKNLFSISGSFRRDGASVFGANRRYGNFGSIGGAWNIDGMDIFKSQNIFSTAKLRASYGSTGSTAALTASPATYYTALPLSGYSTAYGYGVNNGQQYSVVGNPQLTWETQKKFDLGADLGFFKDRLMVSADYYHDNISGLISSVPVSQTTGFSSVTGNSSTMYNQGFEFTVKGIPIKTRDFTWTSNFNFAINKNVVTKTATGLNAQNGNYYWAKGYDYYTYYQKLYAGVNPANGDALWYTDGTRKATTTNYSAAQYATYGHADPTNIGGWSNTFSYKGITLSADFYGQFGNRIYDSYGQYLTAGAYITYNKYQYVYLNSWTTPGQITNTPKFVSGGIADNGGNDGAFSTRYFYSGDFIRLKNLQLGYDFKNAVDLSRYGMSRLFLYLRASNLWTKTYDKRLPFDPEVQTTGASNIDIPQIRTFTIGLNVGF